MKTLSERNERGNTLLTGCDGNNLVGVFRNPDAGPDRWTVLTYFEGNYPALTIKEVEATDGEMAEAIRTNHGGMEIRKLNLTGVEADGAAASPSDPDTQTEGAG